MADQPNKPKKRLVKNPDTFRERAQKSTEATGQPSRRGLIARGFVAPLKPLARLIRRLFQWKPLAIVIKVLKRVGRVIFPAYFRDSWRELKQVSWPNWKQSRQLTFAVLIFAVMFGAAISLVDYGLDKVFKSILLK